MPLGTPARSGVVLDVAPPSAAPESPRRLVAPRPLAAAANLLGVVASVVLLATSTSTLANYTKEKKS